MFQKIIKNAITTALVSLSVEPDNFVVDHPDDISHGDYSSNVAFVHAKKAKIKPVELANKIVEQIEKSKIDGIEKIEIVGGFINFKLKDSVFVANVFDVIKKADSYGKGDKDRGKQKMVEYTDPNPFKVFHIGHLMANAVGESISRLVEYSGAKVIRACYQGDVGLHVAKTIWAILKKGGGMPSDDIGLKERIDFLGENYVFGAKNENDEIVKKEIAEINKKIFEKLDSQINKIYDKGKAWSVEYFALIYEKLDTKFDKFFFESEVFGKGLEIVREFAKNRVFEESDGAIVFKGEKHGLHTRVFITSQGLPTYEAKELGLNVRKFELYPKLDESIIITANEQDDYFKVLLKAFEFVAPGIAQKTKHKSHGMLRFAFGKMSSRTGNVIKAEDLIYEIKALAKEKMSDRGFSQNDMDEISDMVAIGAIRYSILRQSIGSDIIFDSSASISFEGDSGPYLQYSAIRALSVLGKAKEQDMHLPKNFSDFSLTQIGVLERTILHFPEVIERACDEYAPQYVASYLTNLAGAFNSFYANQIILDKKDQLSPYRLAVTKAFLVTMTNGLHVLGIKVPKGM